MHSQAEPGNENAVARQRGKLGKRLKIWGLRFAVHPLILLSARDVNAAKPGFRLRCIRVTT